MPDEQHPTCKRCEKASYVCEGYLDRNFIVFDSTIKHENATQSYKSAKDSDTQNAASEVLTDFNSLTPNPDSTELTISGRTASPVPGLPLLVSLTVDRAELYASFLYKYFYRGITIRLLLFNAPGADIKIQSSLVALSSGALSTSFFGFKTGTQAIVIDGHRQYCVALFQLNQALSHRSPKDDCDVLAAIVLLCLYEVFSQPSGPLQWNADFIVYDAREYHGLDQSCFRSRRHVQMARPRDMFSGSLSHLFRDMPYTHNIRPVDITPRLLSC